MKTKGKKIRTISILVLFFTMILPSAYALDNQPDIKTTRISELQKYADAYIKGEVVKITDEDEFRLQDSSGKIKVYTGWKNTNLVKRGDKVTVRGTLDPGIIKEFYATEIIRENGEKIKLNL
jgi:hypothetical protein